MRDASDPFRKRYRKRLIETAALIAAMLLSLAGWIGNFASYELDQILASDSLKAGFFAMLAITAFFMAASLVWAFRARAALKCAGYERVKELADGEARIV
jgi:anaerobic C4-dicarboxylate transporter